MMNTFEYNNVNEFKQTAIIKFGAISPIKNEVISKETWNVNEDQLGLFFISGANNEAITKGSLEILANGNIRVWSSPIKELPENTLSIDGETENVYITSKVLEPKSLSDWGNGEYIINVDIEGIKSLTLNIEGLDSPLNDESSEQPIDKSEWDLDVDTFDNEEDDLDVDTFNNEEDSEVEVLDIYVLEEDVNKDNNAINPQRTLFEDNTPLDEDIYVLVEDEDEAGNTANPYGVLFEDNKPTGEEIASEGYVLVEDEASNTNTDKLDDVFDIINEVEVSSTELDLDDSNKKSKSIDELLMDFYLNNKPYKIHGYTLNEQLEDAPKSDIIIEKNSDQYLVVINNLFNRPIHLFDGDEPYFKFNGSVDEFINKIMKTICRNYAMTEKEFEEMSKVIILDQELTDEICEIGNVSYMNKTNTLNMNRTNALNMINPKHNEIIIDVHGNECNIIYNNNNDLMRINCYEIDNSNKISMYNRLSEIIKNVGHENTYLTGEVATNEIANLLGIENTERFYSIAKLI